MYWHKSQFQMRRLLRIRDRTIRQLKAETKRLDKAFDFSAVKVAEARAENECLEAELDNVRDTYEKLEAENEALKELVKTEFDFTEEETNDYLKHALLLSRIPEPAQQTEANDGSNTD